MLEDAGAAAIAVHGRTAAQSYSGRRTGTSSRASPRRCRIPVFGNGDCIEPEHVVVALRASGVGGVLVGRGVLRNPWIFAQAADVAAGRAPAPSRWLSAAVPARLHRPAAAGSASAKRRDSVTPRRRGAVAGASARGHERWVINKLRALDAWYTKGLEGGSHFRVAVNGSESIERRSGT